MTVALTLPESTVTVTPGQSAALDVRVSNDGPAERRVRLEAGGRAGAWLRLAAPAEVAAGGTDDARAPDELLLAAGQAETVRLLVNPPAGAAVAGQLVPFTLRATAVTGGRASASATGLVVVSAPVPVTAVLAPQTATGRGRSHRVLTLATDETSGVLVTLRAAAPDRRTRVSVDPVAVRVEPGRPGRADVTVAPRGPALAGARDHAFSIWWETDSRDGLARGEARGSLTQTPLLPPPVAALLAVVLAAALTLGGIALWQELRAGDGTPSDSPSPSPEETPPGGEDEEGDGDVVALLEGQLRSNEGSLEAAEATADAVRRTSGREATVVSGETVGGRADFWVVVVEGFPDRAAAEAFCRRRSPTACTVA